jgi:SAM-dependent methyltransferase
MLKFTGERIVPEADNCEPLFARKMYQEHLARYLFASQFTAGRDVLDVGCGVGYGSHYLAEHGARRIHALDLSQDAIDHAREHFSHPVLEFARGNAEDFELNQKFDVAVCFELIEHVHVQSQVIANIKKHLKEDGLLVISTPRPLGPEKRSAFHTHEMPFPDFKAILSLHFPHLQFFHENNLFISNIGQKHPLEPNIIMHALEEAELFNTAHCDYFVCLASNRPLENVKGSVVVNNEQYIKNLERDVAILHRVENELREHIHKTSAEFETRLHANDELLAVQRELLRAREVELRDSHALNREYRSQLAQMASLKKEEIPSKWQQARALFLPVGSPQHRAARLTLRVLRLTLRVLRKMRRPSDFARAVWRRRPLILRSKTEACSDGMEACSAAEPKGPSDGRLSKITFLIGCPQGESKRYRVANLMEGLARRGISTATIGPHNAGDLGPYLDSDLLVVFRAGLDVALARILRGFRRAAVPTIYDVDDLIFEPESIHYVDALKSFNEAQLEEYKYGVAIVRSALEACDAATCTTEFLRQRIEKLGKKARVVPNTLDSAQIERAKCYSAKRRRTSPTVSIGYFSGTYTHNRDFL